MRVVSIRGVVRGVVRELHRTRRSREGKFGGALLLARPSHPGPAAPWIPRRVVPALCDETRIAARNPDSCTDSDTWLSLFGHRPGGSADASLCPLRNARRIRRPRPIP